MSRAVGNDEFAFGRGKIPIGHVDRDPLLAFGSQSVGQEGRVKRSPGGPVLRGVLFDRGELILINHLRFVEEHADQCAFAIVHRATSEQTEQFLALVLLEIGVDVGGNQVGLVTHVVRESRTLFNTEAMIVEAEPV